MLRIWSRQVTDPPRCGTETFRRESTCIHEVCEIKIKVYEIKKLSNLTKSKTRKVRDHVKNSKKLCLPFHLCQTSRTGFMETNDVVYI